MKLIKKVNIGPYTYKVVQEDKKWSETTGEVGRCINDDLTLVVATSTADQVIQDTLLHEILHAIHYTMDIRLDHDLEEHVVRKTATGLLMVLQKNPGLVKFLTEKI